MPLERSYNGICGNYSALRGAISTAFCTLYRAQKQMILPALIAVLSPIIAGFLLGVNGLMGLLLDSSVSGFLLAVMMSNSGGAWDNAKKYIEDGNFGGKGSVAHKASVIGDTVGDPLKDTSGPAINILIKLISVVAIVFAQLILTIGIL